MLKYLTIAAPLLFACVSSHASDAQLSRDIASIANTSMTKSDLETTDEFNQRVESEYAKYLNKIYEIKINTSKQFNSGHKYLSYDADTSLLTVSLPDLDRLPVWVENKGSRDIKWIYFSFVQTKESDVKASEYQTRNGLGNEVTVKKFDALEYGVAVLGNSNPNMTPQKYSSKVPRDLVRGVLESGVLLMKLRTDLLNLKQNLKGPSIFLTDKETREPSMRDPIEMKRVMHMLPVRLLSITLLDAAGNVVMVHDGVEIDAQAVKD